MNVNTLLLCSVFLYLLGHDLYSTQANNTNLAAIRAVGIQCNKNYSGMVPRLKTYEETYNGN